MTPTERLMRQWLATGTPDQQAHARNRIAIGFAPAPEPTPEQRAAETAARRASKPRVPLGTKPAAPAPGRR